jgi:hypothetical protein
MEPPVVDRCLEILKWVSWACGRKSTTLFNQSVTHASETDNKKINPLFIESKTS